MQGNKSGKGIGLKNIREKLYLIYGRGSELKTENLNNFFTVSMSIPVNKTKSE
jgi:LytS/YehU family sensor histidine kinase